MTSLKRQIFLILIFTACIFSNEKDTCNFSLGDELDFNQISQINLSDFECLAANQENNLEIFERLHKFLFSNIDHTFENYTEQDRANIYFFIKSVYEGYGLEYVEAKQNSLQDGMPVAYLMNIYDEVSQTLNYFLETDELLSLMTFFFAVAERNAVGNYSENEEVLYNLTLRHLENLSAKEIKPVFYDELKFLVTSNKIRGNMIYGNPEEALLGIKEMPKQFPESNIYPIFQILYPIEVVGALSDSMTLYKLMSRYPEFHDFQKKLFITSMKLNLEYLDFEEIHIGTMNQIISNIETVDEMFFCDIPVYELADFFDNDIAYDLFNDVCAGSYTPQIIENIETELNFTDPGWQILLILFIA
jgi:hypothetical protein